MDSPKLLKRMEEFVIFSEHLKNLHPKYAQPLSITQLKILTTIAKKSTDSFLNNIYFTQYLNISSAAISKASKDLIKKTLLTEKPNPSNLREKFYVLTDEGMAIAQQHILFFQNVSNEMENWLDTSFSDKERELIYYFLFQWEIKSLSIAKDKDLVCQKKS